MSLDEQDSTYTSADIERIFGQDPAEVHQHYQRQAEHGVGPEYGRNVLSR